MKMKMKEPLLWYTMCLWFRRLELRRYLKVNFDAVMASLIPKWNSLHARSEIKARLVVDADCCFCWLCCSTKAVCLQFIELLIPDQYDFLEYWNFFVTNLSGTTHQQKCSGPFFHGYLKTIVICIDQSYEQFMVCCGYSATWGRRLIAIASKSSCYDDYVMFFQTEGQ